MSEIYNIYCDESCHLEKDIEKAMVIGGIWCPLETSKVINARIREIKMKHDLAPYVELKWTKIAPSKLDLYLDLIDFFFDDDCLNFRGLIIPDKSILKHAAYNQDHDTWYYKMYFLMLMNILNPKERYRIYIDIKDTRSAHKVRKLHDVLCNKMFDFNKSIIKDIQIVESKHIDIMQLADILIGALSWISRDKDKELNASPAKKSIVERIRKRSKYSLAKSTLPSEKKFNLFIWQGQ
jgi:hypothetical protein